MTEMAVSSKPTLLLLKNVFVVHSRMHKSHSGSLIMKHLDLMEATNNVVVKE